ncbi:hypothetical protein Y1Q_0015082 [Alligator mississippiensis]|uniref:Uncharacterized protein n=1 Tax=Alligator mississippiensis TaxID=8496 RepID=A0A151P8W1_ALLMI|nr:hypothetical protein Y1Q_0015082 [Alligator mississippiensis]
MSPAASSKEDRPWSLASTSAPLAMPLLRIQRLPRQAAADACTDKIMNALRKCEHWLRKMMRQICLAMGRFIVIQHNRNGSEYRRHSQTQEDWKIMVRILATILCLLVVGTAPAWEWYRPVQICALPSTSSQSSLENLP